MDNCPALPATGAPSVAILIVAVITLTVGVAMLVWARRAALPVVAVVLVAGVLAIGATAEAAPECPPAAATSTSTSTSAATTTLPVTPTPTTVTPTTGPASTTTTTTAATTTTTSTTTTTTVPGVAPVANDDDEIVPVGAAFSFDVLANDTLGVPPATITASTLTGVCGWATFDAATGVISGTPVVPFLPCVVQYTLGNAAGTSSTQAVFTSSPAP